MKENSELLELKKEFTDKHGIKYSQIYTNSFAYLYECESSNGKVLFVVFSRLKPLKMDYWDKWSFKSDKEAIAKFNSLIV